VRGWRCSDEFEFLALCHEWHKTPSEMLGESKYWRVRMSAYLDVKRRMSDIDYSESEAEREKR
jgi:hypothetical protein